jgi:anti-anti-sigma factor
MRFSTERFEDVTVFTPKTKKIDAENSSALKAELLIVCQPNIKGLIMDLTSVEYVDSTGLGAILLAHRQLSEHEIPLVLVGLQESVLSILQISQLIDLFDVFDTVDEALEEMSNI